MSVNHTVNTHSISIWCCAKTWLYTKHVIKMFKKTLPIKKQNVNIDELVELARQKGLKVPDKVVG